LFSQKEFFLGFAVDDEMLIAQKTEKNQPDLHDEFRSVSAAASNLRF
jgi:hypothetical protein